jgi:hypothetical protein
MNEETKAALDRLFEIAIDYSTGTSSRVANFLMAWWNARDYGGFDFTDFWMFDDCTRQDCFTVLRFVADNKTYLDELPEYQAKFKRVHAQWRPEKKKRRRA